MKAVELSGFNGLDSLRVVDLEKPRPESGQVLIEVKAAGINFAELELTRGQYSTGKTPPFIMGFEAAGIVGELGPGTNHIKIGDRVTGIVSSGGFAEFATAEATMAIPIPDGISFAQATTIPIQGVSAHLLLKFAAKPQVHESVLIQSAAGGVGIYLVQLARIMGVRQIIALASGEEKIDLAKSLGADVAIDYSDKNWPIKVREAINGSGVDVVLEAASGQVSEESFKLLAPFGRMVMFGAKNVHDTFGPEKIKQLIYKNQTIIGFNIPTAPPEQIAKSVSELLGLIRNGKLRLFAENQFPLANVKEAFEALAGRKTIGRVVVIP